MFGFENLFNRKRDFKSLVLNGAVIIDVRTATEFASGHIPGSTNISLDKIPAAIKEIKNINRTVITCCRSGARSAMANAILKRSGITSFNGGSWNILQKQLL